jgi:hypothetical protein
MGSFNAGQSHINHYLESEENNNIPEINSFQQQDDSNIIFKVHKTNNNGDNTERLPQLMMVTQQSEQIPHGGD